MSVLINKVLYFITKHEWGVVFFSLMLWDGYATPDSASWQTKP